MAVSTSLNIQPALSPPAPTSPRPRRAARILVADDERTPRLILSQVLRARGFDVTAVSSGWAALTCLYKDAFDLVVLDILMPGMDGFDVLRRIRRQSSDLDLPVIMASAKDDSTCIVEALEIGANDYVSKPINPAVLCARIETQLSRKRAFDELRDLKASLEDQVGALSRNASHDPVTGLVNRREFERCLEQLIESARQNHTEHAVCYIDLDQFKIVTNTCGHHAGDELLRELGQCLRRIIRRRDTLARLGGDEFGILFGHCSLQKAVQICHELHDAIQDFRFKWKDQTLNVSASIGLVSIDADCGSSGEVLMQADSACYTAKDRGRNRIHIYRDLDEDLAKRHGELESVLSLQLAMEHDRFRFVFQPIVATTANHRAVEPLKMELLLRLQDPDGKILLPGAFLPAAERYNLAARIDRWVVQAAFHDLKNRPDLLERLGMCSINLSAQSLGDESFLKLVSSLFKQTDLPASKICFEITETAAIANLTAATNFIDTMKKDGVRFALDDFGTGMSSFAYLKNLPVDFVKIDGVFVRDIVADEASHAMVKSINDIAHAMGKRTIAEFVESEAILQRLEAIGVDYVQGAHLGLPQPLEAFAAHAAD